MSETDALVSHKLADLRRLGPRQTEFGGLLPRQQELIGRLERTMCEGFVSVQRDLLRNTG